MYISSIYAGYQLRLNRIINKNTGRTLVIPFDHATSAGILPGLGDVKKIVDISAEAGADAIMLRPGLMKDVAMANSKNLGIILCLTGRLDRGVDHVELNTVEYAIKCGADSICAEFKMGSDGDLQNAHLASLIVEKAHENGMPVLMTIYAQPSFVEKFGSSAYAYTCRVGEELGADIVKTSIPCEEKIIKSCIDNVRIPLIVAGGSNVTEEELISNIDFAVSKGISGAAVGRNVWGSPNSYDLVCKLRKVIHQE